MYITISPSQGDPRLLSAASGHLVLGGDLIQKIASLEANFQAEASLRALRAEIQINREFDKNI